MNTANLKDSLLQIIETLRYDEDGHPDHQVLYDKLDEGMVLIAILLKSLDD